MSYACGPADWIDLAIGRLEDAKRSLRECDRLRQGCDIVSVEGKKVWAEGNTTLDICGKSMDYLCRRLVGDC